LATNAPPVPDIRRPEPEPDDAPSARDIIDQAAKDPNALTPEQTIEATDFLLDDDPEHEEPLEDTIELNVGTPGKPVWMKWTIRAIAEDTLAQINRMGAAAANRQQRRQRGAQTTDTTMTNARIVAAGTVEPDLVAACRERGLADPAMLVRLRFRRKPGLLLQLSGEILSLSGFDDDDIRESKEVLAAGN
jgi:Phage XkdN-like tail assembly chaperone protein, TAC